MSSAGAMRLDADGPGSYASGPRARDRRTVARGFTLLELMVVLAIAGLAATAVLLTLPDDDATLHAQSDAFARQLLHARDEAILRGRTVQVAVDGAGYRFSREEFGRWQPLEEGPFAARAWRDGVDAVLPPRQARLGFRFGPAGEAEPQALLLGLGQSRVRIAVDPAGKVTVDDRPG